MFNHSKRLEVTDQGKSLASQDFDRGRRSPYSKCACDTPLQYSLVLRPTDSVGR